MANFSNEMIWWLLLGVLAGWLLFWFVDLVFRRDGDKATEREMAQIESLEKQLRDQKQEAKKLRTDLDKRQHDNRSLTKLSEELRDSVNDRDQKIANLENALDAAKEQSTPREPTESDRVASSRLIQGLSGTAAAAGAATILTSRSSDETVHDILPAETSESGSNSEPSGAADVVDIDVGRPDVNSDPKSGSLSQRIGATSHDDELGAPDHHEQDGPRPGLLDRLKDSLAGRRPEDLD